MYGLLVLVCTIFFSTDFSIKNIVTFFKLFASSKKFLLKISKRPLTLCRKSYQNASTKICPIDVLKILKKISFVFLLLLFCSSTTFRACVHNFLIRIHLGILYLQIKISQKMYNYRNSRTKIKTFKFFDQSIWMYMYINQEILLWSWSDVDIFQFPTHTIHQIKRKKYITM